MIKRFKLLVEKISVINILIVLIGLLVLGNISTQISQGDIKPFGKFETVLADFIKSAPNGYRLAKNLASASNIQDQVDRCQIVDPNRPDILTSSEYLVAKGLQIKGENIAGANPGVFYGGGYDKEKDEKVRDYANGLGMSYNLAIFYSPDEANSAIDFVNTNIEDGFIPIVRLCVAVPGSCKFNSTEDVINFYKKIHAKANGEFIAMVGPNEPGTGVDGYLEMNGFGGGINSYPQIINFVNQAAEGLQSYRSINGGKLYLTPGAFNLTNAINRDVYEYLYNPSNPKLKINLFDYLMGNVYALGEPYVNDIPYPYATYRDGENHNGKGLGNFAEENNIPVILTEFGILKGPEDNKLALIREAKESFKLLCADETVSGILFFQSFLNDDGSILISEISQRKEMHGLTKQEHSEIIGDCQKNSPYKDWSWANCNFDSCIYKDYKYTPKSTASACAQKDAPTAGDGKPALKLVCNDGFCSARAIKTIDVAMPIKHFGGNSLTGSPTHSYPSICAELSGQLADKHFDVINQFAGVLDLGDIKYPMPWLGSAINCASQLLLATYDFAGLRQDKFEFSPHPGSKIEEVSNELSSDQLYNTSWEAYNSITPGEPLYNATPNESNKKSILDEAAICLMNDDASNANDRLFCYDKRKHPTQILNLQKYNPYKSKVNWKKSSCSSGMIYREDSKNLIYGPEIQLSEAETIATMSESQLCYEFGRRNSDGITSDIIAGIDYPQFFPEGDVSDAVPICTVDRTRFINNVDCSTVPCTDLDILNGTCNISPIYKECFNYENSVLSANHQIYLKVNENVFAPAPSLKIEGIYDALYWTYIRLQNNFKNKNLKVVFRENIGMKVEVNSKIRDANRGKTDALNPEFPASKTENLYAQDLNSCEIPSNMYSYANLLAKNNPIKTNYQYFDWLGYLDIIQEINNIYINNSLLPDISIQNNINYNKPGEPNSDRPYIITSGPAIKTLSYPIYTCDELNLRIAKDKHFSLYQKNDVKLTCVTDLTDNRYKDELGEFLCSKGYEVPGICDVQLCPIINSNLKSGSVLESAIFDDGAFIKIDPNAKFRATPSNGSNLVQTIESFAQKTNSNVAINANTFNQLGVPIGLYGNQENLSYIPPADKNKNYNKALIIGNLNTNAPFVEGNIIAKAHNKFYLMDISEWNQFDANTLNTLLKGTLAGIDAAITGSLVVGLNSDIYHTYQNQSIDKFKEQLNSSEYLVKQARTIVGWDKNGDIIFLVLKTADIFDVFKTTEKMNLSYGLLLEGGEFSQLYYQDGFNNTPNDEDVKIYTPAGTQMNTASYLGVQVASSTLPGIPTGGSFSLIYPTSDTIIESDSMGYGFHRSETWTHVGLDFTGTKGSPIYAAASGTVITVRPVEPAHDRKKQPYGNLVMIEHPNGFVTLYAHLEDIKVSKGDIVQAGDIIGTMGNTGNVYCEGGRRPSGPEDTTCGVHLHFELRKNKNCKWDGNPNISVLGTCTMNPIPFFSGNVINDRVYCGLTNENQNGLNNTVGILSCNLDIKNTKDLPDLNKLSSIITTRIRSYNLDNNLSHTWLYTPNESQELFDEIKNRKFNGSLEATQKHRENRKEVTEFVINQAVQNGVNPKLALTLWIEESAGSALGRAALGCIYFRNGKETTILPLDYDPLNEDFKNKTKSHLQEQIECLASYVNEFESFNEFMCTYSGEESSTCQNFVNNPNFPINVCKIYNYEE
jgi:murein DD-endopeptidase MepM/ murein hydrolase activator NlpD